MKIKSSLLKNFIASSWGKASTVLFRLVQVPLLLYALGAEDYGRWLVLYSLPSWLMLANFGFGSVASTEITIAFSANDKQKAESIYSTTFALLAGILIAGVLLASVVVPLLPWDKLLKTGSDRKPEIATAVLLFALATLLSFFFELFYAKLRAARKAHFAVLLSTFLPWINLLGIFLMLQVSNRFDHLAFAVLATDTIYLGVLVFFSSRNSDDLRFSRRAISTEQMRFVFKKGLAFQAFPLGNALLYQGNLIIVQLVLGPVAVAIFGTVRTLVRSVNQMLELINQAIWPELAHLFGTNDYGRIARLHRFSVFASVFVAMGCVASLMLLGKQLYHLWTGDAVPLNQALFFLFLVPIPFNALWFTSSVVHMASNRHEGLAARYIVATVLSGLSCIVLSKVFGIEGAALSTLTADLVLIPFVFRKSLQLTNDTWTNFIHGARKEFAVAGGLLRKLATGKAA